MNRATEEQVDALVGAIVQALTPSGAEVRAALEDLVNFKPVDEPRPLPGYGITRKEMRAVPFFCETYLYGLLGKEDARSLLGRLRVLCDALGHDLRKLSNQDE